MDNELLKHAQQYIEKMANGIDPISGEKVKSDDLINNVRITRCLFYVNSVLKKIINKETKAKNNNKRPFNLPIEKLKEYEYYKEPISITKIVKRINKLKTDIDMANLKASDVANWLVDVGLLEMIEYNGSYAKRPTNKGKELGIFIQHIVTSYKEFDQIFYGREAQQFILDNFENLLIYLKKC